MADRVAPEWMAYLTSGVSSQKSEPPLPPPVEVKKDTHSQKQASASDALSFLFICICKLLFIKATKFGFYYFMSIVIVY